MACGNANRVVGTTLMNAQSSRSHALLTITVQQKLPDGSTKVSKLNVADLAGSEKVAKTGSTGETLDEAKKINVNRAAPPASARRTPPQHVPASSLPAATLARRRGTSSRVQRLAPLSRAQASLSTLCLVISALSDGKPHIPYRNSKLTRILQARRILHTMFTAGPLFTDRSPRAALGGSQQSLGSP